MGLLGKIRGDFVIVFKGKVCEFGEFEGEKSSDSFRNVLLIQRASWGDCKGKVFCKGGKKLGSLEYPGTIKT